MGEVASSGKTAWIPLQTHSAAIARARVRIPFCSATHTLSLGAARRCKSPPWAYSHRIGYGRDHSPSHAGQPAKVSLGSRRPGNAVWTSAEDTMYWKSAAAISRGEKRMCSATSSLRMTQNGCGADSNTAAVLSLSLRASTFPSGIPHFIPSSAYTCLTMRTISNTLSA